LLGAGAAFHPSLRGDGVLARAAASLALGTVSLTLTGLLWTLLGVSWSLPALAAPPIAASLVLGIAWSRLEAPAPPTAPAASGRVAAASIFVCGVALFLLAWSLATSAATSIDYLLFWGVKAARFAEARAYNPDLLHFRYFLHGVPDYPPAVPIVQAWGAIAAGKMPWRFVPVTSLLWLAASIPLLSALLRRRLGADGASGVTAFWTAALAASLAFSLSGGNAEAPLLFFETGAVAALLVERDGTESRFLPGLMLAGAVLTKVEGCVALAALTAGAAARDALERRPRVATRTVALAAPGVAALGAWFFFQWRERLPVGYRPHGPLLGFRLDYLSTIVPAGVRNLQGGTYGLAWAVPLVLIAAARPSIRRALPALALVVGLLGFLVFDYMHDAQDPGLRISWTAPRVSQPALSACILAAGLASFEAARRRDAAAVTAAAPPKP